MRRRQPVARSGLSRLVWPVLCALALCWPARASEPVGPTPEELELVSRSLRPDGLRELTRNAGPLDRQPLYEVQAELDPAAARVEGKLRLLVTNREAAPWRELVLRLWPEAQKGSSLKASGVKVDGAPVPIRVRGSSLELKLKRPLAPGGRAEVELTFQGRLRRVKPGEDDVRASALPMPGDLADLGTGKAPPLPGAHGYGTFAAGPHGAVLVDWYPQLAARSNGAWDRAEPAAFGDVGRAEPASAVVALTVPRGFHVAGAGAALGQHGLPDGRELATFAIAGARGPLGLAASADYASSAETVGKVELRASSLHGEAGARDLLACGKSALGELERRFGPYPWTSLALADAPLTGGAGGIEQSGLGLVSRALGGGGAGEILKPSLFQFTCWHEVAHQWWQAVVGSDPRRNAWVDEALAQLSAALVAEAAAPGGPSKQAGRDALLRHVTVNFQVMRMLGESDGPVARPTRRFPSELSYAGLIYGKAPHFFARVRELLGDPAFDAAVRAYREAYAFREAGPRGFLDEARAAAPDKAARLEALSKRWLHESRGDEDLGPLDALSLLGGSGLDFMKTWQGAQPGRMPTDAELQQMMQSLHTLMPALQQVLEQLGATPAGKSGPPTDDD